MYWRTSLSAKRGFLDFETIGWPHIAQPAIGVISSTYFALLGGDGRMIVGAGCGFIDQMPIRVN